MRELAEWIKGNDFTYDKIAEFLGISRRHLYAIIHAERVPSRKLAKRIEIMTDGSITAIKLMGLEK